MQASLPTFRHLGQPWLSKRANARASHRIALRLCQFPVGSLLTLDHLSALGALERDSASNSRALSNNAGDQC